MPLQKWGGVRLPVDSAGTSCSQPLAGVSRRPAADSGAGRAGTRAAPDQRTAWATAYADALAKAPDGEPGAGGAPGDYGPVPVLAAGFLRLARTGGLEGALTSSGNFYGGDQTRSLLLLADGAYLEDQARAQQPRRRPVGDDERDRQLPRASRGCGSTRSGTRCQPFSTSDNADALVWGLMMVLTLGAGARCRSSPACARSRAGSRCTG